MRFGFNNAFITGSVLFGLSVMCTAAPCTLEAVKPMLQPLPTAQLAGLGDIIALDVYVEHSKVHLLVASKKQQELRLSYFNSEHDGQSWSSEMRVPTARPPAVSRRGNDVQVVAAGQRIAAFWQGQGEFPGSGPMLSALSRDGGKTWQAGPMPADSKEIDQSHMDVVADSKQRLHLVWLDDREEKGNYQGLRYARSDDAGEHWQHYTTLDGTTCTCCWTSLAVDAEDTLYTLYRDGEPRDMALLASTDGGEHWQARGPVGAFDWRFQGCPHAGGVITATGKGQLQSVVWTGKDGATGLYLMRSVNQGKTWAGSRLPDPYAVHADIAVLDAQQMLAIWDSKQGQGSEIFASAICHEGASWSQPQRLSRGVGGASYPRLVATASGFLPLWTVVGADGKQYLDGWR